MFCYVFLSIYTEPTQHNERNFKIIRIKRYFRNVFFKQIRVCMQKGYNILLYTPYSEPLFYFPRATLQWSIYLVFCVYIYINTIFILYFSSLMAICICINLATYTDTCRLFFSHNFGWWNTTNSLVCLGSIQYFIIPTHNASINPSIVLSTIIIVTIIILNIRYLAWILWFRGFLVLCLKLFQTKY